MNIAGMYELVVITVGFSPVFQLLDDALANPAQSKFLVKDKLETFRGFGGVSIS